MKSSSKRFTIRATFFSGLFFLFSATANAELTLEVTTSTATDFDFTVSGDFSGYTPPASLSDFLYLVPMDSAGNPVTTWVTNEQTGNRPDGAIDGNTITGWVFADSDTRSDDYSFLTGDGFNVRFFGGPFDSSSVMTSAYTRSQSGLTLNPADIAYFNLYWGRTVLLATTAEDVDGTARFNVTKTFSNGSSGDVEVTLTCNGGIPLEQSFTISGGGPGVTFTVTGLPDTGANCAVTESGGNDGYTADLSACEWTGVTGGLRNCAIENIPESTAVTVKTMVDVDDDPSIDTSFVTTISCDNVNPTTDDNFISVTTTDSTGTFNATWYADPDGGASCTASTVFASSAIETADCSFSFDVGDETAGCTVMGTVFFEGIPTLSQYGMAIMVLLMLGVGFIGFRRVI